MEFKKELIDWYSIYKRDLPWRHTKNPYHIWLSEIILQQTQVKQGLPYYEAFVTRFPSVFELAEASEQTVLKLWQGLGYYSRARNLHVAAKYIAFERDGVFPDSYKDLIRLKGVGDYTASAIASIAFNEPVATVDGNVYRVLSRYFGIDTPINSSQGIKEFKALASSLIDETIPGEYNQALMEFGALQCRPKKPYCLVCPLQSGCKALREHRVQELPVKLKKTKVSVKYFNYLVCIDANRGVIFEKREGKGIWQNLYQFPLIESERSLSSDEFDLLNLKDSFLSNYNYSYALYNEEDRIHKLTHQHLHTKFWIVDIAEAVEDSISIDDLTSLPSPVLISEFIKAFNFEAL